MRSCIRSKTQRRRFVQVGKTEKTNWEGCAAGELDQGHGWKCYQKWGKCADEMKNVLQEVAE